MVIILVNIGMKKSDDLEIYFFNAGKADCILISKNDKNILIDTGEESLGNEILAYLKNNNIIKLDYLIITHFDKDHVGSASTIINNIEVDYVLQSNVEKESEYYEAYINALSKKNITPITVTDDYEIELNDLQITVNGPDKIYDSHESNNSSLIVSLIYNNSSFLFMGDAENDRISDYLNKNKSTYNFIKIPYHGNYLKKLEDLLKKINSDYAVITCSENEGGDSETLDLLDKNNIKYYLTYNGSILITSDGNNIKIKQ